MEEAPRNGKETMAREIIKRAYSRLKSFGTCWVIATFVVICTGVLAIWLLQMWQYKEAEIEYAVHASFPRLCGEGFVILPVGFDEFAVSCRGSDSRLGIALTLNAKTCKVTSGSLTLASALEIPPNWDGKLRTCPTR